MGSVTGLILTLCVGLFILLGSCFIFATKNSEKVIALSIGMAFGVMIALIFSELIPEAIENFEDQTNILRFISVLGFTIVGMIVLKGLDILIPHHDHHHEKKDSHTHNLLHIGLISSIAVILHNIIEGIALYAATIESTKTGLMLCIGIGLHNIPVGLVIASSFYKVNKSILKTLLISLGISCSTFIGGLIMFFRVSAIDNLFVGIIVCITLGMLLYISLFELLPKMLCTKEQKEVVIGTTLGIVILFISSLF